MSSSYLRVFLGPTVFQNNTCARQFLVVWDVLYIPEPDPICTPLHIIKIFSRLGSLLYIYIKNKSYVSLYIKIVSVVWDLLYIPEPTPMYTILTIIVGLVICTYQNQILCTNIRIVLPVVWDALYSVQCTYQNQILRTVYYTYYTKLTNINI